MLCPVCNLDLSPLDLVSRTEHVNLCIENGPSILEIDDSGQTVIKRNIPPAKQRKICPICDKTFQTINQHFKVCALKHDVPPDLMFEYWDKISSGSKNPKKFPRDLLDNFVKKCIKEGRIGYQLDKARALSLSLADDQCQNDDSSSSACIPSLIVVDETTQDSVGLQPEPTTSELIQPQLTAARNLNQVLMQSRSTLDAKKGSGLNRAKKSFRLEIVCDSTREANIALRIDREVAATRAKRYEEAVKYRNPDNGEQEGDCVIIDESTSSQKEDTDERNKLFFRARLKNCDGSELCLTATCTDHELLLLMDDFVAYSGRSMDAPPSSAP